MLGISLLRHGPKEFSTADACGMGAEGETATAGVLQEVFACAESVQTLITHTLCSHSVSSSF